MNKVDMILVNLSNHKIDIFEASSSIREHLVNEIKRFREGNLINSEDAQKAYADCIEILRRELNA